MARNHARLLTSIWNDDDFLDLSAGAQRLYMLLLSQQNLSHAGLLPLTITRWANKAKNTTLEQLERWLKELEEARFVVVDFDTEELLIRSFIRGDEVYKQPNVMLAACKDAEAIASDSLRLALAVEVERVRAIEGLPQRSSTALEELAKDLPNPSVTPSEPQAKESPRGTGMGSVTEVVTDSPSPSPAPSPSTSAKPADVVPMRRDVETLCAQLADLMVANGCKRPVITDRWRTAARLLLDRDGVSVNDAMTVLGWSQRDEFWRANIQSLPTFREKFDTLRLQSQRAGPAATHTARVLDAAEERARAAMSDDRKALP